MLGPVQLRGEALVWWCQAQHTLPSGSLFLFSRWSIKVSRTLKKINVLRQFVVIVRASLENEHSRVLIKSKVVSTGEALRKFAQCFLSVCCQ